jgi:hypothetical protein
MHLQNHITILEHHVDQIASYQKQIDIHSAKAREAFLKVKLYEANRIAKEKGLIPGKLHEVKSMPEKKLRFVKMEVEQFSANCFDLDKGIIYAVFDELTDNGRKRPNGKVRLNVGVYGV